MKTFLYICLLVSALALPASERMRNIVFKMASITVKGVEQILTGRGFAEVRMVDEENFDEVINEKDRLVIVDFHHEETSVAKSDKSDLDASINRLPSNVLVAKVLAGRNIELMDRLNIQNIPTIRLYRNGQLLEEFKGKVDKKRFMGILQYHLDNPNSQPFQKGYIGPLEKNWLPEGMEKIPADGNLTPLDSNSL